MLNIKIIAVGKIKNKNLLNLSEEYLKRLKPFANVKMEELQDKALFGRDKEKAKTLESERIEKFLRKQNKENVFLLDEQGQKFTSESFGKFLDKSGEFIFVLAGPLGFDEQIKKRYQKISLSPMTFPHETARMILLEQIYRAASIINKKEYHY